MSTFQKVLVVLSIVFFTGSIIESIRYFLLRGEPSFWAFVFAMAGLACLTARWTIKRRRHE